MAFFKSNNEFGVSIAPYLKYSKILSHYSQILTDSEFDEYCYLVYLIEDPRSEYFDINLDNKTRIALIVKDMPSFKRMFSEKESSEIFNNIYEFLKKFYHGEIRTTINSLRENIIKYKKIIDDSTITDVNTKDNAVIIEKLMSMNVTIGKYLQQFEDLKRTYVGNMKNLEISVENEEDLSFIEKVHIKRKEQME